MLREKDFPLLPSPLPKGRGVERVYHWRWVEHLQTHDLKTKQLVWMKKTREASTPNISAADSQIRELRSRGLRVLLYSTFQ